MASNMPSEESQNNVILATGGYDHTIHFWQAHTGIRQSSVQHPSSQVNSMEIAPKMNLLAVAGFQHIRMFDICSNNPNPVVNYEGVAKNFTSVGFPEDSRWMYTGSEDNSARIWDLKSRMLQCQRYFPTTAPVNCTCLHPNQVEIYIGDQSGAIYQWDLRATDHADQAIKLPFFKVSEPHVSILSIDIDTEGSYMAAVDNKGNCYIFLLNNRSEHSQSHPVRHLKFSAHETYALKCKFSPDSTLLTTTSADSSAKLWRTADLSLLLSNNENYSDLSNAEWKKATPMIDLKHPNQRWVWDIAFSLDSQYLFTASSDSLARLWSISTGEVKREYSGHSKALTALAFRDGGGNSKSM